MLKVGLLLPLQRMWQGGVNYYHNLLSCYHRHSDAELQLEVFTDRPEEVAIYQSNGIQIHACPEVSVRRLSAQRVLKGLLGYDPVLVKIMTRHRIDLLTHRGLGRQAEINTLLWQPDFQHKAFPQFFTTRELAFRDSDIGNVGQWGNILLSSQSAANDFRRYYPELSSVQTRVLHFCSDAAQSVVSYSREELELQYPVADPYLFLPNQFWQHKNHEVVVEALRQTASEIRVICTGLMQDSRNPTYVPRLLDKVKEMGLEQRFICLGEVPYHTVVGLMNHSLAVLQPSLFEGWSTSVEESKAICKQIILSSIDVHLEQSPERGVYFKADSAEELALCMKQIYAEFDPVTEQTFVEKRSQYKEQSSRAVAQDFARILKAVSGMPR